MTTSKGDRWIVPLLAATLLVVVVLFAQALRTFRSHEALVESTLEDFAAFAAERVATELNQTYTAIFLDGVAAARAAHYRWVADPDAPRRAPSVPAGLPVRAIGAVFSVEDSVVVGHGTPLDAATRSRISNALADHRHAYREQAPYAVLRSVDPTAIVYRREEAYGQESVYGFLIDVTAPTDLHRRLIEGTDLLPTSLTEAETLAGLFTVSVHLAPDRPALYTRRAIGDGTVPPGDQDPAPPDDRDGPEAWAFAAKAGRLAVRATIDRDRGGRLVSGGVSEATLPLLSTLALLTGGLIYLAMVLHRRSNRLASLRESFIANVSHDLRTPITQIRMFSETLRLNRLDDPAERQRALEIIQSQTEVLEDLVDNLLHASDTQATVHPVETDVRAIAEGVAEALTPSARDRRCTVEVMPSRPLSATVDPTAVARILMNLLDNAIRHGAEGGTVWVSVTHEEDGVVLTVDDDGPGIPRRDRDRVLERFERLQRAEEGAVTGAGLGLSVVRSLARRHGGDVWLRASPRGGTRVVVRLAAPRPGVPAGGASVAAPEAGATS